MVLPTISCHDLTRCSRLYFMRLLVARSVIHFSTAFFCRTHKALGCQQMSQQHRSTWRAPHRSFIRRIPDPAVQSQGFTLRHPSW